MPAKRNYQIVEPRAAALIESLRAFGYSLAAAIADLIDNSVSANAKVVRLEFVWDGAESYIALSDDGTGMTEEQVVAAMRPGSQNPLEKREVSDLGRFGLGLKTASFSQCRRLTVRSRTASRETTSRCWDLDYVNETQEWRLLSDISPVTEERLEFFNRSSHGTVVLWEHLDRLVGDCDKNDEDAHHHFLDLIEEVEAHLAMVFHRFLSGPNAMKLFINGSKAANRVQPWNPFLENHPATQLLQSERIAFKGGFVAVRPFVLPHHDKIDKRAYAAGAGPAGWNAQQGFYVYRNLRLLVAGDWLGFPFSKEEHYKLARIQVDISNSTDNDWSIDVKKSVARPPAAIRKHLRRIADLTRNRAVEIYRHRGKTNARQAAEPHVFAWKTVVRSEKTFYAINREHPLVEASLDLPKEHKHSVQALLRLLEETVPVQQIWLDVANQDSHGRPFEKAPEKDVLSVLKQVYIALRKSGLSPKESRQHLLSMDAFFDYQHLVMALSDVEK